MATTLPVNDDSIMAAIEQSIKGVEEATEPEPIEGDEPVEPEVVEPAADPAEPVVPVEPAKVEPVEPTAAPKVADPKAAVVEPKPAVPAKKRAPMPMDRHEAVLSNERRKNEAAIKVYQDKYETPQVKMRLEAIEIAEKDVKRFVDILDGDPRYKEEFQRRYGTAVPAAKVEPEVPVVAAEAPKPNVIFEDGRLGYDEKGAQELAKFHANEVENKLRKELDALKTAVAPVTKSYETTEQGQKDYTESVARQRVLLTNARANWKGFTENEAAIRTYVLDPANKGVSLEQAYQNVVVSKLFETDAEKETRIRAQTEDNIRRQAAAGSAVPAAGGAPAATATAKPADGKPRPLEDVIAASIRGLK